MICDTQAAVNGLLIKPRVCPPGYECSASEVGARCSDDGKVSSANGKCVSCPDGKFSHLETNKCEGCPYADGSGGGTPSTHLLPGIVCAGGKIEIKADYYVVPHTGGGGSSGTGASAATGSARLGPDLVVLPCREYGVCAATVPNGSMAVHTECLGNTAGALCALCAADHGKAAGKCVACPAAGTQAFVMAAFALLALALSFIMTKKSLQDELDLDTATVSVLRIGLNFLMMTGFLAGLRLDWGSVLRTVFNVAKAGSGGLPPLVDCANVSFVAEMIFSLLLPVAAACMPVCMLALWALGRVARGKGVAGATIFGASKRRFLVNASIAVAYLLWPALVVQALRILDCSVEIDGTRYVASDVSVVCYDGAHARLSIAAIAELVVVVPALPLFLWYRLRRHPVGAGTFNRSHLYFLYGGYREGYEYWESIVMARKFAVLAVSVFFRDSASGLQVVFVMGTMCAATVLQLLCMPYQNRTEQRLELLSLCAITAACFLGLVILLGAEEKGLAHACRILAVATVASTVLSFIGFFAREVVGACLRKLRVRRDKEVTEVGGTAQPGARRVSRGGASFQVTNPMAASGQLTRGARHSSLELRESKH
eukprot:g7459.t1